MYTIFIYYIQKSGVTYENRGKETIYTYDVIGDTAGFQITVKMAWCVQLTPEGSEVLYKVTWLAPPGV